jgi:hypothetical protein
MFRNVRRKHLFRLYLSLTFGVILLVTVVVMLSPQSVTPAKSIAQPKKFHPKLNIGDYVRFANYQNATILWRVIHLDDRGNPLLLSDRILTLKAFDARGSLYLNDDRKQWGSNDYETSTIRQWLNSSQQNISWIKNKPAAVNLFNGQNAYDSEKGFLSDGNFTANQRSWIVPHQHTIILSDYDDQKKIGGLELFREHPRLPHVIQNHDKARYHKVTDSVFILSVLQLKRYVYDNRNKLGNTYHMAKPTVQAVSQSTWKDNLLNINKKWVYWLNTPVAKDANDVRVVFDDGVVDDFYANADLIGVRPAVILDVQRVQFKKGGNGTEAKPYFTEEK